MQKDPFGLPSKKKLTGYACVASVILFTGCAVALYQGTPLWRVLLLIAVMVTICGGATAGIIWLSSGRRSEIPVGPAGVRPPERFLKAMPLMLTAILVLQILMLLGSLVFK